MKMKRYYLIKSNKTYTEKELSETIGATTRCIQNWLKEGMPKIENSNPVLFMGKDIKEYLKAKLNKKKANKEVTQGKFSCFRCRKKVDAEENSISIVETGRMIGRYKQYVIKGKCKECGGKVCRLSSSRIIENNSS